jgi:hypothetical protein
MPSGLLLPYHVVGRALFLVFIVHVPCSVFSVHSSCVVLCYILDKHKMPEHSSVHDQGADDSIRPKKSWTAFKLDK